MYGRFPAPPPQIRSGNGKVYIHWDFHRDERACGTFGAEAFILNNAGAVDEVHSGGQLGVPEARGKLQGASSAAGPRRLAGPQPATREGSGQATPRRSPSPSGPTNTDLTQDAAAMQSARWWSQTLVAGDTEKLLKHVSMPFSTGGMQAVHSKDRLGVYLRDLAVELKGQTVESVRLTTAAALLKELGGLPAGVEPAEHRVFARVSCSPDRLVLILDKRGGYWRISGLARE